MAVGLGTVLVGLGIIVGLSVWLAILVGLGVRPGVRVADGEVWLVGLSVRRAGGDVPVGPGVRVAVGVAEEVDVATSLTVEVTV